MLKPLLSLLCGLLTISQTLGGEPDLRLPHVFSDHMVFQRHMPVPIWGFASPGARIEVEFGQQHLNCLANAHGQWSLKLSPLEASTTPQSLIVQVAQSTKRLEFHDVLVGEVWFCSGQSNMEMPAGKVDEKTYRGDASYEETMADDLPNFRILQVPHWKSGLPLPDTQAQWWICDRSSAYWCSAVAFFFARKLHQTINVPVGVIISAWGGSSIQPWTPRSGFYSFDEFAPERSVLTQAEVAYSVRNHLPYSDWLGQIFSEVDQPAPAPSSEWLKRPKIPESGMSISSPGPTTLYNGMVAPIVPYAIRGVLWYQGESNLGDGALYAKRLEALIKSWRHQWDQGDFPFYYVQLAPYTYKPGWPVKEPTPEMLPQFWKVQSEVLAVPNTAMVSTQDLGDLDNIHPQHKAEIGERLAELALQSEDQLLTPTR